MNKNIQLKLKSLERVKKKLGLLSLVSIHKRVKNKIIKQTSNCSIFKILLLVDFPIQNKKGYVRNK